MDRCIEGRQIKENGGSVMLYFAGMVLTIMSQSARTALMCLAMDSLGTESLEL